MHTHADRTIRRARNVSRIIGAGVGFVFGVLYGVFVLSSTPGVLTQNTTTAGAALLAAGAACERPAASPHESTRRRPRSSSAQ